MRLAQQRRRCGETDMGHVPAGDVTVHGDAAGGEKTCGVGKKNGKLGSVQVVQDMVGEHHIEPLPRLDKVGGGNGAKGGLRHPILHARPGDRAGVGVDCDDLDG